MPTFAFAHLFAYDGIHIDHGIEEQTQEQPLIEEPEDPEPDPQQEGQQQAIDSAPEETDPSEEDILAAQALAPMNRDRRTSLLRMVWSSFSVPVLAEELVTIRSMKRLELANGVTSVGMMLLYFCKSFGYREL
ncbi:hypothetical protein U9M48_035959 [Paspalum notatum var. saurae]|uniref:Uncharacterized protein n=1 Tax=Paspalum notatum var. saurae TaxID=547442 RepID=A0AAQ3X8D1_PASNO